jgi:2-keto-4-pentenoate hydratase/2-oxohepta-3-ene-1,7-dioic acid hydratase in catechol pathway
MLGIDEPIPIQARTAADPIARPPRFCTLESGDLLFTGTPAGIGATQGRLLHPGDIVVAGIEHVGSITTTFVEAP